MKIDGFSGVMGFVILAALLVGAYQLGKRQQFG